MDKWDELVDRIKHAALAEEPEAALAGVLQLFAEFGRTLEQISFDMDRIATALEGVANDDNRSIPPELRHEPPEELEHDL